MEELHCRVNDKHCADPVKFAMCCADPVKFAMRCADPVKFAKRCADPVKFAMRFLDPVKCMLLRFVDTFYIACYSMGHLQMDSKPTD